MITKKMEFLSYSQQMVSFFFTPPRDGVVFCNFISKNMNILVLMKFVHVEEIISTSIEHTLFISTDEEKNSYGQKTLIAAPLLRKPDKSFLWNAVVEHEGETSVSVNIFTHSEAVIGKWKLDIDTKILDGGAYCYSWEKEIYLLFNPWCKKDRVYLSSEEWRTEAVLNDTGLIWRGTFNRMKPVIWKYDQFEGNILDCSLYVLHEVGMVKGKKKIY